MAGTIWLASYPKSGNTRLRVFLVKLRCDGKAVHGLANQAPVQGGGQGFLSCPEVVGACGLAFSPGAPLPSDAGLRTLSSIAVKYLGFEGQVCQNF